MTIGNFSKFTKNMLAKIEIKEATDFLEKANASEMEIVYEKKASNLFYSVDANDSLCTELLTTSCAAKFSGRSRFVADRMISEVTAEPVELQTKMNLNDILLFCENLAQDDLFYGIICIADDGTRINPFHPLVAKYLAEHEEEYDKTTLYRVVIFAIQEGHRSTEYVSNILERDSNLEELFIGNINKQLELADKNSNVGSGISGNTNDISQDIFNFIMHNASISTEIKKSLILDGTNNDIQFLIPCQFLVNRLGIPYYGSALIRYYKATNDTKGSQISPMMTPNLGSGSFGNNTAVAFEGSVCTGNLPSNSVEGLQRFNIANLDSPYFYDILSDGWFQYAKISIEFALNIYRNCSFLLDENANKSYKEIWIENNPELTELDFMQHLRDKILSTNQGG